MSLRRENLEELRIILFEMFAVHLKIVYVYYIFVTLLIGGNKDSYSILYYRILSIKQLVKYKLFNTCCSL